MNAPEHYSDALSRSELFAGISPKMLKDILGRGIHVQLKPGEKLFHEGEHADRCYLVIKGRLKLSKLHEQGKEIIIRYIDPGAIAAAIAVFKGKRYPVTATATGAVEIVGWDRDTMINLISSYGQLAVNLLQFTIDRIEELQNRFLELSAEQVERRIARALLRIMRQSGLKTGEGVEIEFKLSRQDLADYTGTTIYTVSRTLSSWGKKGWVKSGRQRIVITDPHALVGFSENN
jgi:CRP/FNR family transcriptional regulator, nitrogen oxide reductase regulator